MSELTHIHWKKQNEIVNLLAEYKDLFGNKVSRETLGAYADRLINFTPEQIKESMEKNLRTSTIFPTLNKIIENIPRITCLEVVPNPDIKMGEETRRMNKKTKIIENEYLIKIGKGNLEDYINEYKKRLCKGSLIDFGELPRILALTDLDRFKGNIALIYKKLENEEI